MKSFDQLLEDLMPAFNKKKKRRHQWSNFVDTDSYSEACDEPESKTKKKSKSGEVIINPDRSEI